MSNKKNVKKAEEMKRNSATKGQKKRRKKSELKK
jgi:hypothetical protein